MHLDKKLDSCTTDTQYFCHVRQNSLSHAYHHRSNHNSHLTEYQIYHHIVTSNVKNNGHSYESILNSPGEKTMLISMKRDDGVLSE